MPLVIAIVGILAITSGVYLVSHRAQQAEVPSTVISSVIETVPALPVTNASGQKVFTDPRSTYSFSYPSDFALSTSLTAGKTRGSYSINCDATGRAVGGRMTDVCLWYVGDKDSDGFEAADMEIYVTPKAEDCKTTNIKQGPGVAVTQTKVINGITYYYDQYGDASTGHRLSNKQYRTFYSGNCYTINLKIGSNIGEQEKELSREFFDMMFAKLESVFATFKFKKQ